MPNYNRMRQLLEAARRDRNEQRFFDDFCAGLEAGEYKPQDFSIRALFEHLIEDGRELVDSWNPRHGGGSESQGFHHLVESGAVNVGTFSNITGQIVFSEIQAKYDAEEFVFSKLIPSTPTQFNGEKIPGIGEIGDKAETIPEMGSYPLVGVNEDWQETPLTTKRGLVAPLTKEAVFFDRTGVLLERCGDVGTYLGVNKEKRAVDCVIDENTTTHRYNRKGRGAVATYGDNSGSHDWDNLQASNALVDWTDIDNAEQLLNSIVDPNTGEPIVVTATTLICAKSLQYTAERVVNATEITVTTPGYATSGSPTETKLRNPMAGKYTVVTSRWIAPRLATDTDWFYGDLKAAFRYMENWPLTTVQAPSNSELEFMQDIIMRWKASERGAYSTRDPRKMVRNTA